MAETRKIAAILVADVVGYSRLAEADEDRTLSRLRGLRSDLIDPAIAAHHGRIVKRTGDGILIEFRSVVDAVRCGIEVQNGLIERNAGLPPERRIEFRVGIHLGDVVEESDGDLMGDGVNIATRLEGIAKPSAICLSEQAYWQVKGRLDLAVRDLGPTQLKNIVEPIRVYSFDVGQPARAKSAPLTAAQNSAPPRLSIVVMPFANIGGGPKQEPFVDGVTESLTTDLSRIRGAYVVARNTAFTYKGRRVDVKTIGRELNVRYVLEGSVQRGSWVQRIKRVREPCPDLLRDNGWRWRVRGRRTATLSPTLGRPPAGQILLSPKSRLEHRTKVFPLFGPVNFWPSKTALRPSKRPFTALKAS
jgi:adenylate cyclase